MNNVFSSAFEADLFLNFIQYRLSQSTVQTLEKGDVTA
jgi:hypothetical protein